MTDHNEESHGILAGYVDRKTAAAELHCSEKTLARYETLPDGLPSVSIGGKKFYRIEAIRAFLERRERRPNPVRKAE